MKICIYGAGAVGGFMGARLAALGTHEVSAVARGATLQALRGQGWRVRSEDGLLTVPAQATDDPASLGVQDLVVVAVKATGLSEVARRIGPLIGPRTIVLPAMNGVPWWFMEGMQGSLGAPLESVDPGGEIAAAIPLERVVGCVVHLSTLNAEPGLVVHQKGEHLIIGEPLGDDSDRVHALAAVLKEAGFTVEVSPNVRQAIWYKLWGNMTMNPVSAVTSATIDHILDDPQALEFCSAVMREAQRIGAHLGCTIEGTPEDRHAVTRRLGAFKTSMLQDAEAGRAIELDALVTVVRELAQRVNIETPATDALLGLTRVFARVHGLYPAASA